LKSFLLALRFLTILPLGRGRAVSEVEITRAVSFFPLAGALQGLVLLGVYYLLGGVFGGFLLSAILVMILALSNGGFHLDGFMDTVDGLACGGGAERRLKVMSDPSAGAVGVVFTVLLLILKVSVIAAMPAEVMGVAVFLWPIAGRWSVVPLAYWSTYARPGGGLGRAVTEAKALECSVATGLGLAFAYYFMGTWAVPVFAVMAVEAYMVSLLFRSRLGGVTGDVFGFQAEVSEVFFLLLFLGLTR